jgi:hypothetical protein
LELLSFIRNNYSGTILTNNRSIISNELDIYLPELEIAFEFNGLYWHSELHKGRNYHISKTNECLDKGINLIHIWEDDWDNKKDIVKSIILNKLGRSNKIFARRCEIKIVNNKDVREFLLNNHIQGFVGSKIKLGLYYENELVSLMTFGNLRKSLGQVSIIGSYELLRFCNKLNINVIGGASKLLKYFIKIYGVKRIVSYADKDWSIGSLYYTLGFENIKESKPDYKYIVGGKRIHKSNFKKSMTGISESKLDIPKIYDCGKIKFEYLNI